MVKIHDLLHEWDGSAWQLRVSAYEKLRIAPDRFTRSLERHALAVEGHVSESGMIRLVARKKGEQKRGRRD